MIVPCGGVPSTTMIVPALPYDPSKSVTTNFLDAKSLLASPLPPSSFHKSCLSSFTCFSIGFFLVLNVMPMPLVCPIARLCHTLLCRLSSSQDERHLRRLPTIRFPLSTLAIAPESLVLACTLRNWDGVLDAVQHRYCLLPMFHTRIVPLLCHSCYFPCVKLPNTQQASLTSSQTQSQLAPRAIPANRPFLQLATCRTCSTLAHNGLARIASP